MDHPDRVRAVSDCPFFQAMAEEDRVALATVATLHDHAEGEVLFSLREMPSALYMVVQGVAEISRPQAPDRNLDPVAYVGAGAILAASKVITGRPFEAEVRFPEGGRTLQWARPVVLRRLHDSRAFSMHYLHNLARRVEGSFADQGRHEGSKLGGRLEHFDLATILQTVVQAGANGLLEVLDAEDTVFGSVYTFHGRIGPVVCGDLTGQEAFYEILVSPPIRGSFTFSSVRVPQPVPRGWELAPLLFEAARLQDELRRFLGEFPPDPGLRLTATATWRGRGPSEPLVERILAVLREEPVGFEDLVRRVPYCRARVAVALRQLLRQSLVDLVTGLDNASGVP